MTDGVRCMHVDRLKIAVKEQYAKMVFEEDNKHLRLANNIKFITSCIANCMPHLP